MPPHRPGRDPAEGPSHRASTGPNSFSLQPGGSWGDLVTAIVTRDEGPWTVSGWVDAPLEGGGDFQTIDELVAAADRVVARNYPQGPHRASAEMQYAIYPWTFEGIDVVEIFEVTGTADGFSASASSGSGLQVRAETVEALVGQASLVLGGHPGAMFRWGKEVSALTAAD